jgi:hypothetical protein
MAKKTTRTGTPSKVRFFYIKGNHFRVLHVDGALGGITPRGFLHFSVYSERPAIPQTAEHQVSIEGRLSEPLSQEGKQGIVRELDADLIMTKQTATELRDWLSKRIEQLERLEGGGKVRTGARNKRRRST